MPYFLVACITIVIAILAFWFAASGVEPSFLLDQFASFKPRDKAFVSLVAGFLFCILGYAIWQNQALAQQRKAARLLQNRLDGVRREVAAVEQEQRSHDAVLLSLVGSDPEEAIGLLRKRLTEAEQLALVQQSRNQAVDSDARVEDIRRRQQALREQLGEIVERRRSVDPVFSELRERQVFIERALSEFEKDEANNSIEARVKLLNDFLMQTRLRMASVETAFAQLNQLKADYTGLQDNLGPFRSSETGIKAMTKQVLDLREKLAASLSALEQDGDKKLTDRVERIAGDKDQHAQRVETLTELFSRLAAIRNEVGGLFTKLSAALERDMKS
jgi:hypothetical protein